MINRTFFVVLIAPFLLSGCSESGSSVSFETKKAPQKLESEMSGSYIALLSPINKTVSGHLNGSLTVVRETEKDEFIADVRFSGGPASVLHDQNIHIGDRCPTEDDDLNKDGYVDGDEGANVYKEIYIPLDDDLSSQRMGGGIFPVSDEYGYYFWSRAAPFMKVLEDLREEDINHTDDFIKISPTTKLDVLGKVIVIKGVPESVVLPDTVAGRGRHTAHQALPVACGVIRRLMNVPGAIDRDHTGIPVPEGETVGGSGGADDGAFFPRDTSTTVGTGNYGEDEEMETPDNSTEFGSDPDVVI